MTVLVHPYCMSARIPLPHPFDHDPFTVRQGRDAGLSPSRLRGPDLNAPFHGIRMPVLSEMPTARRDAVALEKLCSALQRKLPDRAWFCGVTAAVVMGIPLAARLERCRTLHVAVTPPHRTPRGRGVRGHTFVASAGDVRLWHGIRISSPERVWCELGGALELPDLVAAGDYLIQRRLPLTSLGRLTDAVAHYPGRRGIRTLKGALPLLHDRSESRQESRLRVIVVLAGFLGLEVNYPVTTSGGYDYRGDLAFPRHKVFIEYQSELHRSPETFQRDMTRISRLEADGWYVMQINIDGVADQAEIIKQITEAIDRDTKIAAG